MRLTRRTVTKAFATLLLGAGAGLSLPRHGHARTADEFARELETELTRAFRDVDAGQRFAVPAITIIDPPAGSIGGTRMRAQVALTWRPGYRSHPFTAEASSAEAAFDAILDAAIARLTPAFHPPDRTP